MNESRDSGRRSIRLTGYDYSSAGAYFITLCSHRRQSLFGEIVDDAMELNACGKAVEEEWKRTSCVRPEIRLDAFVVMPNHFHGIFFIHAPVGAHGRAPVFPDHDPGPIVHGDTPGLSDHDCVLGAHGRAPLRRQARCVGSFMAGFKSASTKRINAMRGTAGAALWQKNYWERVIRDENELNRIREYIQTNPKQWTLDRENPQRIGKKTSDEDASFTSNP